MLSLWRDLLLKPLHGKVKYAITDTKVTLRITKKRKMRRFK